MNIETAAVIGAGVMGAAIAAHLANAGVPVYLLDIVPKGAKNRNVVAATAIEKLLAADPAPFMLKKFAKRITPGNIEDHLGWLAEADWVIEAVVEDLGVKQALYRQLHDACRLETLISSNTSTLPLHLLAEGMPEAFRLRFMISHFFNPPRYMRLLELVAGPDTRPEMVAGITAFADLRLGKGCVICKDTPGFIANRIGTYWLQFGLLEAVKQEIHIEEADALFGAPLGIPKTGIFGLLDLIGIDLLPHILDSLRHTLPPDDALQRIAELPEIVRKMLAAGNTGRKGKGGFYRLQEIGGQRIKEAIDLQSGVYRPSHKPQLKNLGIDKSDDPAALLSASSAAGRYAWQVLSHTLNYTAGLLPEIADDITAIDNAMRLGFNWKYGPFELLDRIGIAAYVDKLQSEGRDIPKLLKFRQPFYKTQNRRLQHLQLTGDYRFIPQHEGVPTLSEIKLQLPPVLTNASASLWDAGDGVACLEFHSKMNTLDLDTLTLIEDSVAKVKQEFAALLIYNDGDNFSAGANLNLLTEAIAKQDWEGAAELIRRGQQAFKALKYAPFPVVGAPAGLALGGGCEILLHCDARQAYAELYIGLVETSIGLVPGWGGCKEYLGRCMQQPERFGGPIPPLKQAFETIAMARVSKSAYEARELLFLSASDGITMNRQRLLGDAKAKALALAQDYRPQEAFSYRLPGKAAKALLDITINALQILHKIGPYDAVIASHLAQVLSGGACDIFDTLNEDDLLTLEREVFVNLVKQHGTQARLEHLLTTGKPLRN